MKNQITGSKLPLKRDILSVLFYNTYAFRQNIIITLQFNITFKYYTIALVLCLINVKFFEEKRVYQFKVDQIA
jgi:hypothetical protein